jgi:hypothetical protein
MKNARQRIKKLGDLWTPLLPDQQPRVDLMKHLQGVK